MLNNHRSSRAHVVIVDDESITRKLLSSFLKRDAYKLYEAATGQHLLDNIDEWRPDVILLDVLMPGMDGYAVCRKLRANPQWRHIPVIMITALNRHDEMVKGLQVGADEFLTKPVSGLALSARVQSMVRIKRQYDELRSAIQFRDTLVDTLVHDMRNSMSVVTLRGQRILRRSTLESTDRSAIESIVRQVERLNAFVTDLSLITQLETQKVRPDRIPTDFVAFVTKIVQSHHPAAEAKRQKINVAATVDDHQVAIDPHLMERLLNNLLANTIVYSAEDGTIELRLQDVELQVEEEKTVAGTRLVVEDCASNIPDKDKESVLDSAMSLRNPRMSSSARFGMELALANAVVTAHGGRIWLEDNTPQGVRFCLEWPNEDPL